MNEQKFPKHWGQFFDEAIPAYVKAAYSPNPKWKDKPFSKDDLDFYAKGVRELSNLLRSDRTDLSTRQVVTYFEQAKFRSAYLLYFLNLQAAKFYTVFDRHSDALSKSFDIAIVEKRPFRVLDLGSGPATASIALALWARTKKNCPEFEFTLVDQHKQVLDDGKEILSLFAHFTPGEKSVKSSQKATIPASIEHINDRMVAKSDDSIKTIKSNCYNYRYDGIYDFSILGHVLNETETPIAKQTKFLSDVYAHTSGAGVLIIEPADKVSSQRLGNLRNNWLGLAAESLDEEHAEALPEQGLRIWGPCFHEGRCPLTNSRDWCHFSFPADIPGKWFRQFSERLGSKREWLKFSYLWMASSAVVPPVRPEHLRLVVSDILRQHGQVPLVLLCEPENTKRISLDVLKTKKFEIVRGDVVKLP